jgi:hypothetical protein
VRPTLTVDVDAPGDLAWAELIDLSCWPSWGPTVRSARLDEDGPRLHPGATGWVETALGLRLPFEVDGWRADAPRRSWSWRVAGVHATEHSVVDTSPSSCRVEMSVPWWAAAYLGVVGLALLRIRRRVESRAGSAAR